MGVKSLWTLLSPVGRPVLLDTMEGKTMAIDSSIWIYQFQATMRDKEGKGLVNAHVLGFLRRISKLLFYGIKPVFVFDGGAPALKRSTLNERKKKKAGAALSHAKLAEKILAAQMRKEAVSHAQATSKKTRRSDNTLDEHTVYLEDIDGSAPKTPVSRRGPATPSSSGSKNKFRDHDPYRLPDVDVDVAKAASTTTPDPRLATEDELRTFIEEMRPDDFDITSPAFRELPTEIQYEIVGDLRLKSRQTSYARLQNMLKNSKTPLDFSKQQIKNLQKRNALTQQLLVTTDTIGSSHLAIPVRIASERNKEYILMKNEGVDGGWILGVKDTGTADKPIVIDQDDGSAEEEVNGDSDDDMEEVTIPTPAPPDPDLRSYQQEMALEAISSRNAPKRSNQITPRPIDRKNEVSHLFVRGSDEDANSVPSSEDEDVDDDMLAFAVQESLNHPQPSPLTAPIVPRHPARPESPYDLDGAPVPPTRLHTQLSIGNVTPARLTSSPPVPRRASGATPFTSSPTPSNIHTLPMTVLRAPDSDEDMEEVVSLRSLHGHWPGSPSPTQITKVAASQRSPSPVQGSTIHSSVDNAMDVEPLHPDHLPLTEPPALASGFSFGESTLLLSDGKLGEENDAVPLKLTLGTDASSSKRKVVTFEEAAVVPDPSPSLVDRISVEEESDNEMQEVDIPTESLPHALPQTPHSGSSQHQPFEGIFSSAQGPLFTMSRTPSPTNDDGANEQQTSLVHDEDWDAAQEMDIQAEENEFAQFISRVKGRNLDAVQKEIDEELRVLNQQRKAALRDSEDVTQQMITQIMTMLRLFGIPYITAPMEAEAQCAELVTLGLVDGVITDDSDVFLFGAQRVYKNMFNQSKTVECFVATDLQRELGLDRETLIQLAYLLGSDYTDGLPGVGPVLAMELLKEFPGTEGLIKFREWWSKVQTGRDKPEESATKFRRRFKKRFKELYLTSDWPNSVVRDAYYHPTVDTSKEPFKWALPDLDGLQQFLRQELGWKADKVDELLLPIIQRMNKRSQVNALNKQGNLNDFFDISAGTGAWAPRQRQAYSSRRLQQVITDFRKRQKSERSSSSADESGSTPAEGDEDSEGQGSSKGTQKPARKRPRVANEGSGRKRSVKGKGKEKVTEVQTGASSGTAAKTGRQKATRRGKGKRAPSSDGDDGDGDAESDEFVEPMDITDEAVAQRALELNLRPRPQPRPVRKQRIPDLDQVERRDNTSPEGEPPSHTP